MALERDRQQLAWHYTSAEALISILHTDALRATSAAFMNDANEMKTGVRALKRTYERMRESFSPAERKAIEESGALNERSVDHLFLLSASRGPDRLTLWRNYGGATTPYAIGLDRSVLLRPLEVVEGRRHPRPPEGWDSVGWEESADGPVRIYDPDEVWVFGGQWNDVMYVNRKGTQSHEQSLRALAKDRMDGQERGSFLVSLPDFADSPVYLEKDASFEDEDEVRLVVEANPSWKFLQFRGDRFGAVPYVELSSSDERGRFISAAADRKLPIREIWIGPSADAVTARRALESLLHVSGYGDVHVRSTSIPYR